MLEIGMICAEAGEKIARVSANMAMVADMEVRASSTAATGMSERSSCDPHGARRRRKIYGQRSSGI